MKATAIKEYSTFPKAQGLKPHHLKVFCNIKETCCGGGGGGGLTSL